ncbi:hypothetical protein [Devosia sp.]|uniref:hypothetical protein n=2 Tax=Devosia sp. TaxID=1871048 RepID=UPI00292E814A|nr:hypothetical protein [Devosia sp.]
MVFLNMTLLQHESRLGTPAKQVGDGGSDDGGDNASDASDTGDTADADYLVDANGDFILDANGKRIKKPKTVDFSTLDVGGRIPC